jgi:hypothetical protein
MTIAELIERLQLCKPNTEVMLCTKTSEVDTPLQDVGLVDDKLCLYDY